MFVLSNYAFGVMMTRDQAVAGNGISEYMTAPQKSDYRGKNECRNGFGK